MECTAKQMTWSKWLATDGVYSWRHLTPPYCPGSGSCLNYRHCLLTVGLSPPKSSYPILPVMFPKQKSVYITFHWWCHTGQTTQSKFQNVVHKVPIIPSLHTSLPCNLSQPPGALLHNHLVPHVLKYVFSMTTEPFWISPFGKTLCFPLSFLAAPAPRKGLV